MNKKLLLGMICLIVLFAGCESLDRVITEDRVVVVEEEKKTNIIPAPKVEEPQIIIEETREIPEMPQEDKKPIVWPYVAGGLIIAGLVIFALSKKRKS